MPIKVLHVIPSVSVLRGGPSTAIVEMVKAQRALGIDACIATTNDHGDHLLAVNTQQWSMLEGVPCRYFSRWNPALRPLREFAYSGAFNRWFRRNAKEYELIHIHALFSACSSFAMFSARRQQIPYVVRTIGQLDAWSLRQSALRKKLFLWAFERRNLRGAAALHATSEIEAVHIQEFDNSLAVTVVPLGIVDVINATGPALSAQRHAAHNELKRSLNIADDARLVLFLARLHPKKGLESVLHALATHAHLRNCHLLVAGSGHEQYESALMQLRTQLGLTERVHFLGFLQHDAKRQALLGCELYVLPSASENFGISVLEAWNAGLPCVISTGVALHPIVTAEGLGAVVNAEDSLSAEGSSPTLGDAIAGLLQDRDVLLAMSTRARQYSQAHYTWTSIASALHALYARILGVQKP